MYEPKELRRGYLNVEAWVTVEYRSKEQKLADQAAKRAEQEKIAAEAARKAIAARKQAEE